MSATVESPPRRRTLAHRPRKVDEITQAWERVTKLREAELASLKAENAELREWVTNWRIFTRF